MSLVELREVLAPQAVEAFIRSQLESGGALSEALGKLPLDRGRITSPLPHGSDDRAPASFKSGGVTSRLATEAWIADEISRELAAGPARLALFEDQMARPEDAFLTHETLPHIFLGETLLYVLREGAPQEQIVSAFRSATSYMMIAALIDGRSFEPSSWLVVDASWRAELASRTSELFIGAYDQEGILIWRSGKSVSASA